jgi:putative heme transporter
MLPRAGNSKTRRADGGSRAPGLTPRRLLLSALLALSALGGLYLLAGSLQGFAHTWAKLRSGDPAWLAAGAVLELLSIAGYAALFFSVVGEEAPRIGWRASFEIPLAGIAAIRLLATGGAGGFAVSAWALARAGMAPRAIGSRLVASQVVEYAVYMCALLLCGVGLWVGLFPGGGSFVVTIVPALFGLVVIITFLGLAALPWDPDRSRLAVRLAQPSGRISWRPRLLRWLLTAGSTARAGTRWALSSMFVPRAERRSVGLLGALAYWGFDVAVLWCSFRAFGAPPALAVVVMGYFVGTLAGLLPLPGGIGGVEGGMIGAFIAFGVPAGEAVVAVLAYRTISFWLPTLPGVAGYLGLRRTVRGWELAGAREGVAGAEQEGRAGSAQKAHTARERGAATSMPNAPVPALSSANGGSAGAALRAQSALQRTQRCGPAGRRQPVSEPSANDSSSICRSEGSKRRWITPRRAATSSLKPSAARETHALPCGDMRQ